jgi:hypothetical protein
MLLWTRAEAARLTNLRATERVGGQPGPEGSIAKLQMAELNKAIYELCVDLLGTDGLLIDGYGHRFSLRSPFKMPTSSAAEATSSPSRVEKRPVVRPREFATAGASCSCRRKSSNRNGRWNHRL